MRGDDCLPRTHKKLQQWVRTWQKRVRSGLSVQIRLVSLNEGKKITIRHLLESQYIQLSTQNNICLYCYTFILKFLYYYNYLYLYLYILIKKTKVNSILIYFLLNFYFNFK